nr:restriction endonuclease subunit S [Desulfatitalea alkaliphila]
MRATATEDEIVRFHLAAGDVLITKDSEDWKDIGVPALILESADDLIAGYHLALLRPFGEWICGAYLFRSLQSTSAQYQFHVEANGVTRYGLTHAAIKSVCLPAPPLPEQAAIVKYLDYVDRRVRRLIRAKRKLIALLTEQKQAIIHQAVTRGLDPDVPLKDSGVQWLGKVPEHWDVVKLHRVTISRCDGPFGSALKSSHYSEYGIRVVRLQNIGLGEFNNTDAAFIDENYYNTLGDHSVIDEDILIAGLGDKRHPAGRACVAPKDICPAMVKADCFRFRINQNRCVPKFLALHLSSTAAAASALLSRGATRQRTNLQLTGLREVAVPNLAEQIAIMDYLCEATVYVDMAISRTKQEIELLNEYRTRLIADVVTGKLDVREAAAALPEVDPLAANDDLDNTLDNDTAAELDESEAIPMEEDT